ncbi:MAG: PEGA domain-containing protein [Blastocatellia bacterium]
MVSKNTKNILISLLVILLFSCSVFAQREITKVENKTTPTRPTLGALTIVTDPAESIVYLNNKKLGATDKTGELSKSNLKPSTYTVVIKRPEYEEFRQQIKVIAGEAQVLNAKLKPTFALILLTLTEFSQDLEIELDDNLIAKENLVIDKENKSIRLKTTPGQHQVKVRRVGYLPFNNEVAANVEQESILAVSLSRVPVNLLVKSLAGARLYLNDEPQGKIPETGSLKIADLQPEQNYKVRLELEDYEAKEQKITTSIDKDVELNLDLTPLPTSAAFSDTFLSGLTFWDAPKLWKTDKGLLYVQGESGVGLPKNKRYRDCNISFGLRLNKAGGASWVVRARDKKNYYLFCLGSTDSNLANQFSVYICRDGVLTPGDPALPLPIELKPGDDYRIRIQVVDNVIQHWITPSNIGEEYSLSLFKDPNNTFPIGGAGFMLLDGQDFLVNAFVISLPTDVKAVR